MGMGILEEGPIRKWLRERKPLLGGQVARLGELERLGGEISKEQMDEWHAARRYEDIARRARDLGLERVASILEGISRDESRHYNLLDQALMMVGAVKPRE